MNSVSKDMQNAIPTDFDINEGINVGQSNIFGKSANSGSGFTLHIENFYNNTDKDIEQLAYEFEFYRQRLSLARVVHSVVLHLTEKIAIKTMEY